MGMYQYLIHIWQFSFRPNVRPEYISKDINDPVSLSGYEKKSAQKAILWLLSKASHSSEEIADHFDISSTLVEYLLEELVCEGYIIVEGDSPQRYNLTEEGGVLYGSRTQRH